MARRVTRSHIMKHLAKKGVMAAVTPIRREQREQGVLVTQLKVDDGYQFKRYAVERAMFRVGSLWMNHFLRRRPGMPFDHKRNLPRRLLYTLPAFREWTAFMPNALALEPLHDPEQKRLVSGGRIDPVLRRLFRHSYDPIGIRTRTVTGAWLVHQHLPRSRTTVQWLSLAGGTGITSFLMLEASGLPKASWRIHVVDLDTAALDIFPQYAASHDIPAEHIQAIHLDVLSPALQKQLKPGSFDVIELMGIFEYFDHANSVKLLRQAYAMAQPGGIVIFGNMRRKNPVIHLNQRGVGWPGVVPRSIADVTKIVTAADIPLSQLTVFQPGDGVYNVYQLVKADNAR